MGSISTKGEGGPWRIKSLWAADLWGALIVAAVTYVVGANVDSFSPIPAHFLWLIAPALGILAIVWNRSRVLASASVGSDNEYGEILRAVDTTLDKVMFPYTVVTLTALASAVASLLAALCVDAIEGRLGQALLATGVAFLLAWTVLGALSILRIEKEHDSLMNRVRAVKEADARRARASKPDRRRDPQ